MSDNIVERVARAIYMHKYGGQGGRWDLVEVKDVWHDYARAALSALPYHELLRDALSALDALIKASSHIHHWHDGHDGGMVVSGSHVHALWEETDRARATAEKIRAAMGDAQ